jgi:hypothetical protein
VTTAADAAPGARRASSPWQLLDRPLATAAAALAGWAGFVLARWRIWANGNISLFVMSGVSKYSHPAAMRPPIGHVPLMGYDGQFYYRLAIDPFNWGHRAYGITMDHAYRYTRLGYPLLAWLASLGHAGSLPTVLVLINLVSMATIGWLGGVLARDAGRHALWGLLLAGYYGTAISVGRDTAEPLADALMLAALLALRRDRRALACALVTGAVVTDETILVLPAALAAARLCTVLGWRRPPRPEAVPRPASGPASRLVTALVTALASAPRRALSGVGRTDLVWLVPGCAWLALQGVEHLAVTWQTGASADVSRNLGLPFQGMEWGLRADVRGMSWSRLGMYDINLIELASLGAVVLAGFCVLRSTMAPRWERLALGGFVLVEMVLATWQFWGSTFGDGRAYVDCYLLAIVVLLATPSAPSAPAGEADGARTSRLSGAASLRLAMPPRRLGLLAAIAVAGLIVVARRRILFE